MCCLRSISKSKEKKPSWSFFSLDLLGPDFTFARAAILFWRGRADPEKSNRFKAT